MASSTSEIPEVKEKLKKSGSLGSSDTYLRADKIDLTSLDIQLEKQLAKTWGKANIKAQGPKEDWEIDLAKLEIRYVIAQGTYGTVYRGTYDGQDVAVKLLDWGEDGFATEAETAALRTSFKQEVAVWHKLGHPNVTKFVGASMGTTDLKIPTNNSNSGARTNLPARACCVVVEYLAGGTLKQYLIKSSRRKLAYKVVVQLALDLSRGLSYLHSRKIVHRDVKSENMLLDMQRNLKIADFGVARVEAQNPKDMTGATGTLGYMAPEVLDGKPYNRKCDVYSFGICLWEIYCCDMPYPDLSFADVSSAVVHQNLRPDIPRCCPSAFANIMRKCWDANPDKRPDMDEVVQLMEALDNPNPFDEMAPPLFLSLPSPPPPLPHLSLHPKAPQALTLAASPLSSRKHSSVCSVASPRHSDYFDPRAPPPPPPRDGHGRPPPPPPPQGGQDGRVFASYNIYKGKAALSFDPRPPQFVPLDSGAYKVAKEGFVLLQFAPAVSPRQYDWTRKQVFSLSVWEMGSLLTLGPTDSCEFFHDPFKGRSDEGKVRKVLKVEPTPDGNGRFFNLSVQNRLLNIDESIYIPISKGEFAVIVSTFNYIIPHLMGWSTFTNSIKPEDSRAYSRPQSGPEYEWRR